MDQNFGPIPPMDEVSTFEVRPMFPSWATFTTTGPYYLIKSTSAFQPLYDPVTRRQATNINLAQIKAPDKCSIVIIDTKGVRLE